MAPLPHAQDDVSEEEFSEDESDEEQPPPPPPPPPPPLPEHGYTYPTAARSGSALFGTGGGQDDDSSVATPPPQATPSPRRHVPSQVGSVIGRRSPSPPFTPPPSSLLCIRVFESRAIRLAPKRESTLGHMLFDWFG